MKGPITAVSNWSDGLLQRQLVDLFIPVSRAVADGTGVRALEHRVIPNFVPDETALPPDPEAYLSRLPAEPYFLFVVSVLGQWPREAVQLAWSGAIAAVVPSICQEACPTVVIEAMRAGRPTIASNLGGSTDLIDDGETGILIDPGDRGSLLAALRRLATSPTLASSMGDKARQRSAAFTASSIVPQIERAYEDVIGKAARVSR